MMTLMDLPPFYSGVARVFPVLNNVLFPAVLQSVQVSDKVGIQLVEHALSGDKLIAFATQMSMQPTSRPGFSETAAFGKFAKTVPIYRMVCLARIVEHEENKSGYAMSMLGIRRAWIRREVPTEKPFRMADLQIMEPNLEDNSMPMDVEGRSDLSKSQKDQLFERLCLVEFWNRELRRCLRNNLPELFATVVSMQKLLDTHESLETMTDLATHLLRLPVGVKLEQLQTLDSVLRAQRLISLFRSLRQSIAAKTQAIASDSDASTRQENNWPGEVDHAAKTPSLIKIDYQSAEFEISVQHLEDENRDSAKGKSKSKPSVLDDTVQDFHEFDADQDNAENENEPES